MPATPCPVSALTGALGAGKTTLLRGLLARPELAGTAVIVNEFGAVGIDDALVRAASSDVVLLPGGCLCCEARADLSVAMLRLERGARRGELPPFRRIAIETSGLAEPGPLLELFAGAPEIHGRFRFEALVAVIDAQLGRAALEDEGATAWRQALLADRLLLTKWEAEPAARLDDLEARLAELNPLAERGRAPRGEADPAWLAAPRLPRARAVPPAALRALHDEAVSSFVLHWNAPQPLAALGEWLHRLAEAFGPRLLRVKGIVQAAETPQALVLHVVQHQVSPPEYLPTQAGESRVVFITRGLEPGDVLPPWPARAG